MSLEIETSAKFRPWSPHKSIEFDANDSHSHNGKNHMGRRASRPHGFQAHVLAAIRKHMRAIVYGGTDGIITIFAVVAGVSGAALSNKILLIIGVATLFADAVSMSVSDYMSSTAEAEIESRQRKEKYIEYDLDQSGLIEQMRAYFTSKGFSSDESTNLANTIGRNREATVDLIISISENDEEEDVSPLSSAFYTFLSFVFFGMVPLIADVMFITLMKSFTDPPLFLLTSIITACTLALLGALKSIMAKSDPAKGALFMVVVGGIASFISWFIAYLLSENQLVAEGPSGAPPS